VELLEVLQEEYNDTREKFAEHREAVVPSRIGRRGDITPEDAIKIRDARANEITLIEGPDEAVPVANSVAITPQAAIDPMLYDTTPIRADFDLISGVGDANRGAVVNPKTATEAGYLQAGMMSRTGERREQIESQYGDLARYAIEVFMQEMTQPQVARVAGAGAVWPELTREEIFDLVQIEVIVGSSGNPSADKERDQWVSYQSTLVNLIVQIGNFRLQGMNAIADALAATVEETLRRFDDRMDAERFLPGGPDDPGLVGTTPQPAMPGGPGAMMPGQPAPQGPPGAPTIQ